MPLLKIQAKNFQIHGELDIDLNGESALVIGDSGKGKSTFIKLILAHIGQVPYPSNPLKDGEKEGWTKTTFSSRAGVIYTINRNFVRQEDGSVKLNRFEVRGPDNRKKSLEEIMDTVFDGAFTHARFDYNEYFNKSKSPMARYTYFVNAIGGDIIEENFAKIDELEDQRAQIGGDRAIQKAVWENRDYNIETIEEDTLKYSQERNSEEATVASAEYILKNKKDASDITAIVLKHTQANVFIQDELRLIVGDNNTIVSLENKIKELQEQLSGVKKSLAIKKENITKHQKSVLKQPVLDKHLKKIEAIKKHNEKVAADSAELYNKTLNEIVEFKSEKESFFGGLKAFQLWQKLDVKWTELDQQIKDKRADNDRILKEKLPLPELSIGEAGTEKKKYPIMLYNGREFGPDNLSTGEAIQITAAIQLALNPNGDNFIVIPQAQSLGSKLKDIQAACKQFGVQYLVEMTQADEEFHVEVIGDPAE